jgi:ABC-2 type transport system ATP-binding protein
MSMTELPEYALEAVDLRKTYGGSKTAPGKEALKGVTLRIKRGSIFGLLGPNGAGKSTFINIFAGLVNKTSGKAVIWGRDIDKEARDARAAIGIVPQEINMDVFFTPFETLELMAGFYGVPKVERRTEEILAAVGLSDKRDAYVRQLSGGMKRRLLVAKALVHNPPILVLDEPTAGVDIELRRQLWAYVRELHAAGTTIVLTTHYLEEAQELCDEIAIVDQGEVIACEPKESLLKRLDTKVLVIDPVEVLDAVPETLAGFEAELRNGGSLAVSYKFGEQSVAEIIEKYNASGARIADLRTEEPDLEDVFMALTYKRDGHAA